MADVPGGMLNLWVELSLAPCIGGVAPTRLGRVPNPVIPEIPSDEDVMLDPWVTLPLPPAFATVQARYAPPPPVRIPEIPADGEW